MIRNYNKNSGSSVDLSPIYSQLNTINNWILNADIDTRLSQSVVNLSNDFTNFTNTIDDYLDNYIDETLTNITNSITQNANNISVLNNEIDSIKSSTNILMQTMTFGFNSLYDEISDIKAYTSSIYDSINSITSDIDFINGNTFMLYTNQINYTNSINDSINSIIENTSSNYTRITKIQDDIYNIKTATFDLSAVQLKHDSSITNLNSSVNYILSNLDTNPHFNLIETKYSKTIFSKSLVCFYNPIANEMPTLWVNDLIYNSVVQPDQYISFYGAAISSTNSISLNMYLFNLTAEHGIATFNTANINTINVVGGKLHNSYGLDLVFNSGMLLNATFNSCEHIMISNAGYNNLEFKDINRCELYDNTKLFYTIKGDNIWQFQFTNSQTQQYTQKLISLNNCSIVSLSSIGSVSSIEINNCVFYTLDYCTANTVKITCTNTNSGISTKTVGAFWSNSIQLLSVKNIANNLEYNTISTCILEYPVYELAHPHMISANSIDAFYFEYYDYSYLDKYLNRVINNTIKSLYLPVECNYYQTINNSTYKISIFNSISEYFKSKNLVSYFLPWFR